LRELIVDYNRNATHSLAAYLRLETAEYSSEKNHQPERDRMSAYVEASPACSPYLPEQVECFRQAEA
jgi:hypothetical protein